MKQKIYILGLITVMVILLGTIFKVNHWPAAGIMLTAGLVTLVVVFIPLGLADAFRGEENKQYKGLYIITGITCFVVFTAMLFKLMHWPSAGLWLTIALPFPYVVFLPVYLVTTSRDKNASIYNIVFVLILVVVNSVFSALLALSVSRQRIDDSLVLARNFIKTEAVLVQLPEKGRESTINAKIDEVIKIINEYRETILKGENLTVSQWNENPGIITRPESLQIAAKALENSGDIPGGTKLTNGLKSLLSEIEKTPGCENLAAEAPVILNLKPDEDGQTSGTFYNMSVSLAWSLVSLEDLETNLKMMKLSLGSVN